METRCDTGSNTTKYTWPKILQNKTVKRYKVQKKIKKPKNKAKHKNLASDFALSLQDSGLYKNMYSCAPDRSRYCLLSLPQSFVVTSWLILLGCALLPHAPLPGS